MSGRIHQYFLRLGGRAPTHTTHTRERPERPDMQLVRKPDIHQVCLPVCFMSNKKSNKNFKWLFMEGLLANDDVESSSNPCGIHVESLGVPFKDTVVSYVKTLGHVFWDIKSPCGNGDTHSRGFPDKKTFCLSCGKKQGRVLGGITSPGGNGDTHSLGLRYRKYCFPYQNTAFSVEQNPGACFLKRKNAHARMATCTP